MGESGHEIIREDVRMEPCGAVEVPASELTELGTAIGGQRRKAGMGRKLINFGGNVVFVVLIFCMAVLVISMIQSRMLGNVPTLGGYQMYIVLGGSMSPTFEAGSLAFVEPTDARNIVEGDIITYVSKGDSFTTHRVMEVNHFGDELAFTTRGDANLVNDSSLVYPENLVGRVVYAMPYAGFLMDFGQTPAGLLSLIIAPGLFIIAFEVRNIMHCSAQLEEEKEKKLGPKGQEEKQEPQKEQDQKKAEL